MNASRGWLKEGMTALGKAMVSKSEARVRVRGDEWRGGEAARTCKVVTMLVSQPLISLLKLAGRVAAAVRPIRVRDRAKDERQIGDLRDIPQVYRPKSRPPPSGRRTRRPARRAGRRGWGSTPGGGGGCGARPGGNGGGGCGARPGGNGGSGGGDGQTAAGVSQLNDEKRGLADQVEAIRALLQSLRESVSERAL